MDNIYVDPAEREKEYLEEVKDLTPKKIVEELNKYIIGQDEAKRKVAIALRNRYRRSLLPEDLREEIIPKNILMIGPTGVGKTEIARRLAKLAKAPFLKIEATKFTEVGYVGRDVESMIRDLMEIGIRMVRKKKFESVKERAKERAVDRIVDEMIPMPKPKKNFPNFFQMIFGGNQPNTTDEGYEDELDDEFDDFEDFDYTSETDHEALEEKKKKKEEMLKNITQKREELKKKILSGSMDEEIIEIEVQESSQINTIPIFSQAGLEEIGMDFQQIMGNLFPKKSVRRKMKIKDAIKILMNEEAQNLIDHEEVKREAVRKVEQHGIIFLDEMDKIAGKEKGYGPDVSREGVQRDILPIVEGSTVITKYGPVKTDHILFIAAGAFNVSKPSDLIPELQGRFPIRVELSSLHKEEFVKILTEPKNALTKQYKALLASDGVEIEFTPSGIEEIAKLAQMVNESTENIGARRLHTVMEKLLEDLSFEAPFESTKKVVIDAEYVRKKLADIVEDQDLTRYIL